MGTLSNLRNLSWNTGQINPSGIKNAAYYFRKIDVKTFPTMAADPKSVAEAVTYDGDFELVEGATAIEIYSTQGKGKVEFDTDGDKDCKVVLNKLTLSYPDMSDEAVEFVNANVNGNGIFIVPHYKPGGKVVYVVVGSQHMDAEIKTTGTSGDTPGSARGLTIEVSAPDFYALPRYTGIIPLPDGTLNCSTGVFTPTAATPSE